MSIPDSWAHPPRRPGQRNTFGYTDEEKKRRMERAEQIRAAGPKELTPEQKEALERFKQSQQFLKPLSAPSFPGSYQMHVKNKVSQKKPRKLSAYNQFVKKQMKTFGKNVKVTKRMVVIAKRWKKEKKEKAKKTKRTARVKK
jgi:hypothetical protein